MKDIIQRALDKCGYDGEPTEENIIDCFLDFVDGGVFEDLDVTEAEDLIQDGEITIEEICYNLIRVN